MLKPKKLKKGDVVAVLSPSWGGPAVFPKVYENGLKVLKKWGLKIKEYPTTRADPQFLSKNPKARAQDLNKAFADTQVKAIFASIGGNDSIRILPYLNKKIILKNPKILFGFSDTTTLLVYLNQLGFVSFHGPSIMAGFSQMQSLPKEFENHVYKMLFQPKKYYEYFSYKVFCDGYPDWEDIKNLGKTNKLKKNQGWRWLQGKEEVVGELFGGCLEVLEGMKSTKFYPEKNFWNGKIFFLETSEDKPTLKQIENILKSYGKQGVFNRIAALVFGRARDFSDKEKSELEKLLVSIISKEFNNPDLPIVANVDFGHTDPQLVLPLGVKCKISPKTQKIALIESWLKE